MNLNIQLFVSRSRVMEVEEKYYTLSLPVSGWSGNAAPYVQTIALDSILETARPKVYFDVPANFADLEPQQSAFTALYDVETADGAVTFKAKELPEVAFNVTLEVSRI